MSIIADKVIKTIIKYQKNNLCAFLQLRRL